MTLFKVVLIGDCEVGKSSTFIRFRDGIYEDHIQSTIGLDNATREVTFQIDENDSSSEKTAQIQLWDTAGLERAGRMTSNYFNFSHGVILMYDVCDISSLNRLQVWHDNAVKDSNLNSNTLFFLVGNKIDCTSDIEVEEKKAAKFAKDFFGINADKVFRVSAKTAQGLNEMLASITKILSGQSTPVDTSSNTVIEVDKEHNGNCGC